MAYLIVVVAGGFSAEVGPAGLADDPAAVGRLRMTVLNRWMYLLSPSLSRSPSVVAPGVLILYLRILISLVYRAINDLVEPDPCRREDHPDSLTDEPRNLMKPLNTSMAVEVLMKLSYFFRMVTAVPECPKEVVGFCGVQLVVETPASSDGHVLKLDATCWQVK